MADDLSKSQIAALKVLLLERQAELKALDEEAAGWSDTVELAGGCACISDRLPCLDAFPTIQK